MRRWWQCDKCNRILPEGLMNMYADTSLWCDDCFMKEVRALQEEEEEEDDYDYDPDPPRKEVPEPLLKVMAGGARHNEPE